MELPWPHERRCILCMSEPSDERPFSRAHLIPASLGGFAWSWTECKKCNEEVGNSIEAHAVDDDSIRLAVDALRGKLPELAARFDRTASAPRRPPRSGKDRHRER